MTAGQANCPAQLAPKDLGAKLVYEMMNFKEGQDTDPALTSAIKKVNDACVAREKVPDSQQDLYARYVIARVSHDELVRRLSALKVPIPVLDRVFDIGPGRTNPEPDKVSEAMFNALVEELSKAGVDIDKLPDEGLGLMGAYVTVSGEMYRDQALIR
ncbi:MAG: hypothetical protein ACKOOL_00960 [Novosphingobium sp.]